MSDLVKKIEKLCNNKDMTFYNLEQALGFGNGTIRRWNDNIPKTDRLSKVADYFHVSIDYLLGRNDEELDEDIIILNRAAKNMTPEKRKKLLEMAKIMFEEDFK